MLFYTFFIILNDILRHIASLVSSYLFDEKLLEIWKFHRFFSRMPFILQTLVTSFWFLLLFIFATHFILVNFQCSGKQYVT